jgi:uncharacterized protein YheU (UPF0270 family)
MEGSSGVNEVTADEVNEPETVAKEKEGKEVDGALEVENAEFLDGDGKRHLCVESGGQGCGLFACLSLLGVTKFETAQEVRKMMLALMPKKGKNSRQVLNVIKEVILCEGDSDEDTEKKAKEMLEKMRQQLWKPTAVAEWFSLKAVEVMLAIFARGTGMGVVTFVNGESHLKCEHKKLAREGLETCSLLLHVSRDVKGTGEGRNRI